MGSERALDEKSGTTTFRNGKGYRLCPGNVWVLNSLASDAAATVNGTYLIASTLPLAAPPQSSTSTLDKSAASNRIGHVPSFPVTGTNEGKRCLAL